MDKDMFLFVVGGPEKVKVISYGTENNDKLNFQILKPFKFNWEGIILNAHKTEHSFIYTDKLLNGALGLKKWEHTHIIKKEEDFCTLTDQLDYQHKFVLMTWLFYPIFYFQFRSRKKIYKKYVQSIS